MSHARRHVGRHRATQARHHGRSAGVVVARVGGVATTGIVAAMLANVTASSSTADPTHDLVVQQALAARGDLSAKATRSTQRPTTGASTDVDLSVEPAPSEVVQISAADAGVVALSDVVEPVVSAAPPPPAPPSTEASAEPVALDVTSFASAGSGLGLGTNARRVYSAIRSAFDVGAFSGYRGGDMDHGTGRAVDAMISSQAQGDAIAAFVLAHAKELNVKYVIWRQRIYNMDRPGWRGMANRGSITANHYDHVHVSVY